MDTLLENFNFIFALGGIVLFLSTIFLIFDLYTDQFLKKYIIRYGMTVIFSTTFFASILTLVYSEVFGFIPCGLCWLQRSFLYPQVFLSGTALWQRKNVIALYGIILSIPGVLIGLYQHYLQTGGTEFIGCPVTGAGADCAERILFEFGFITFPLLSAVTFGFIIALYFYLYHLEKAPTKSL